MVWLLRQRNLLKLIEITVKQTYLTQDIIVFHTTQATIVFTLNCQLASKVEVYQAIQK